MTNSREYAGVLGPTMMALAVTEALNLQVMASNPPGVGLVYLNGTLLFVGGLAVVRRHKRSPGGWPVLITVMGWFVMIVGLLRMFAPASSTSGADWVYGLLIALFAIGAWLTFKGYARSRDGSLRS